MTTGVTDTEWSHTEMPYRIECIDHRKGTSNQYQMETKWVYADDRGGSVTPDLKVRSSSNSIKSKYSIYALTGRPPTIDGGMYIECKLHFASFTECANSRGCAAGLKEPIFDRTSFE